MHTPLSHPISSIPLIGITGGIGSGKSTLAAELVRRGYPVYDSDKQAKHIIVHNPAVRSQIELLFGSEVFEGDRYLTSLVSQRVFANPSLLHRLNAVVHPAVRFDLQEWQRRMEGQSLCFVESAILYSSGLADLCDHVVLVTAPDEVRIDRVLRRDYNNLSTPENLRRIHLRIDAQQSEWQMADNAICVNNDGTKKISTLVDELLKSIKID